jgi:hypothetical protein
MVEKEILTARASKNKCFKLFLFIAKSKTFDLFVTISIITNTVILALDRHPIDPLYEQIITVSNLIFYCIFLLEMVIKLIGLGCN